MEWVCPYCTMNNKVLLCSSCGKPRDTDITNISLLRYILKTDVDVKEGSIKLVIFAIRELFNNDFSVYINHNGTMYPYKGANDFTIHLKLHHSHYTLVTDSGVLDFGQYNLASDEKDSGDTSHELDVSVREEYNNFLKSLGVVEKMGNCCFPKCLLMALFMKEFKEEKAKVQQDEDAKLATKLAKAFQKEEKEKLLLVEKHAELAAKLAHYLDTKDYQKLLQQKEKDQQLANLLREEEDAKYAKQLAEHMAKMGLSG